MTAVEWLQLTELLRPVALALIEAVREVFVAWFNDPEIVRQADFAGAVKCHTRAQLERMIARGAFVDEHGVKFAWDVALEPKLRAFVEQIAKENG